MAELRRANHSANHSGAPYVSARQATIVQLLDLRELRDGWGVSPERVYRAVNGGLLHRFGRPGRQAYYSWDQVVAVFGAPVRDPFGGGGPVKKRIEALPFGEQQQAA
jgi:hypothetical protein